MARIYDASTLRIGVQIDLRHQRCYDFMPWGRVEAIGHDWIIVRDENGRVHIITDFNEDTKFYEWETS